MPKVKNNKFVSSATLSRTERAIISQLEIVTHFGRGKGKRAYSRTNTSVVWKYFGALHQLRENVNQSSLDVGEDKRMYCG